MDKIIIPKKVAYYQRLSAYVLAAMLTQLVGDENTIRNGDEITLIMVAAKVLLAGVIVWRAFIDKSIVAFEDETAANKDAEKESQLPAAKAAGL